MNEKLNDENGKERLRHEECCVMTFKNRENPEKITTLFTKDMAQRFKRGSAITAISRSSKLRYRV